MTIFGSKCRYADQCYFYEDNRSAWEYKICNEATRKERAYCCNLFVQQMFMEEKEKKVN